MWKTWKQRQHLSKKRKHRWNTANIHIKHEKTRKPVFKAGRTCYIMLLLRRSLISSKRNAVLRFPATCHDSDMAISQGTEYAAWRLDLWRKTLFFEKATRKVIHSDTTSRTFFSSLSLILKFWCLVTFLQIWGDQKTWKKRHKSPETPYS